MLYYKTYTESNAKEWVVMVHGAGGSSAIWFQQVREYIKHFNVLLIDLRGHGKSAEMDTENHKNKYSFRDVTQDVLEVLSHLKIQSAHFVGISLGTIIIRMIGEINQSCLKSMILGGAVTHLNLRSKLLVWAAKMGKDVVPFIWLYKICAHILMPHKRHEKSRSMFIREAKKLAQSEFLRWFVLTTEINPLLKRFIHEDLHIPTLYLMGDEDYMFLESVKKIAQRHTHAVLRIIKDSGHVCNVDQADIFNAYSVDFIKKISLATDTQHLIQQMKAEYQVS